MAAYAADDGPAEPDANPHWHAYLSTKLVIDAAEPRTLAGMMAKARAAKAEAMTPAGTENPNGSIAVVWACDLMNDLMRLAERLPLPGEQAAA